MARSLTLGGLGLLVPTLAFGQAVGASMGRSTQRFHDPH